MNTENIAYSVLELSIVSEGQSFKETLNNSLALAKVADRQNYKRYWFAEHHNSANVGSSATSVLIGYVAENTKNIRVGSGGIMLPNHAPLIIAEQFGTLAHLYPNRIDLGLGRAPGTDQETAREIRSDFMEAAHSFPKEIAKIQTYFSPENRSAKVRVPIAEGTEVPIYILGSSTDSAHLAAEKGLPYAFASHFASAHLHNALRVYKQEFQPSEFLGTPYTIAGVNVIVADTDAGAQAIFTSLIKMFVGVLTGNREPIQPPTQMNQEIQGMYNHPAVNQMLKYSFVGSRETVKEEIQQFIDQTEVDELIVVSTMYDLENRLKSARLFGEIMTEINAEKTELEHKK